MKRVIDILKHDLYIILIIITDFAISLYFFPQLPQKIPVHWNSVGQIDRYGSRFTGTFVTPIVSLVMYLVLLIIPIIDPHSKNFKKFGSSLQVIKFLVVTMPLVTQTFTLLGDTGVKVSIRIVTGIVISAFLILRGNVMGRFRHNYFIGIRTPWTLANEEVWRKTHRVAGPISVLGGFAFLILTIKGAQYQTYGFFIILALIGIAPFVYSYLVFRRINDQEQE